MKKFHYGKGCNRLQQIHFLLDNNEPKDFCADKLFLAIGDPKKLCLFYSYC